MPAHPIDEAWYKAFAATLEQVRTARPDLKLWQAGPNKSVLTVAIEAFAHATKQKTQTVRRRWGYMRENRPDLVPQFMLEATGQVAGAAFQIPPDAVVIPPQPEPKPRTVDDDVALHRAREAGQQAQGRLKEALAKVAALEDEIARYESLGAVNPHPAAWTLAPRGGGKSEHMPYLLTSDFQIGEVIRPEETDSAHGFDTPTFRRRYRTLIEKAIDLALNHEGGWTFPGFVYARGGDTISGAIHEDLAETDDATPIEAVLVAFEEESAGIAKLADAFGLVEVKSVDGGNHDRRTHKPRSKRATAHSYDRLVSYMLRKHFRDDPRVTFQGTESPDVLFRIYDQRILLTHGDKIGSRGGMGFIGPAATIARGAQRVIMEQQALGRDVDEVHVGHFHTALDLGFAVCNGGMPGYSEFAKMNRMRPEPPIQTLMFYHPVYGRVATKKIVLEPPLKAARAA